MSLCNVDQSQLAILDIQERLGAVMPSKVINRVLTNTSLLLRTAALLGVPVLASEQYPKGLGPTLPAVGNLIPNEAARFEKTTFSAARSDGFMDAIEAAGRPQVILAGMEAHICVLQTAIHLHEAGKTAVVVEDAICSRKLENYQNALDRLRQHGVLVVSTESVLFEWMQGKDNPHFKALSALVR